MQVINYYTKDLVAELLTFEDCEVFIMNLCPPFTPDGKKLVRILDFPEGPAYDIGKVMLQILKEDKHE